MKSKKFYKEIDLKQSCVSRVTDNSFLLKNWTISTITIALHQFCIFFVVANLLNFKLL